MKLPNPFFALALLGMQIGMQNAYGLHFVAYGDSRTNAGTHQQVIDAISKVNPELIVVSGDLWDGYGPETFKSILTKNANIADLLDRNLFLVARGNHETVADMLAFKPTLVREGKELYAFSLGDCFFVSLGMDPGLALDYLERQLQTGEAKRATWKFVYSHFPVYSTGTHGSQGIPALEKLCDRYGVNLVLNGHDHDYERSQQMYGGKIVDKGDALNADAGTVYIVSGGGGAPLYPTGTAGFSHFAKSSNNFTDIVADANHLSIRAMGINGAPLDAFTLTKPATVSLGAPASSSEPFRVNLIDSQSLAILAFDPIQEKGGSLEIHSPAGALLAKEALASGQRSASWSYGHAAPGEYIAVLRDGGKTSARKIALLR
jgi:hypothetical protein